MFVYKAIEFILKTYRTVFIHTGKLVLLFILLSCKRDPPLNLIGGYDIILIAGQSNTHLGEGEDTAIDKIDSARIKQLGRFGSHNMRIVAGREPLEHWTKEPHLIGFGGAFTKKYADKYLSPERKVLLVPCGYYGSGFSNHCWNKEDSLYKDAVFRARYALSLNEKNKLVAILWHQGETDAGRPNYQSALDSMIVNMRKDINDNQNTIFVLGGMVPYWVDQLPTRALTQTIISNTPLRMNNTAYASPYYPYRITKTVDTTMAIHYDAAGQRILGERYFHVYDSLRAKQ